MPRDAHTIPCGKVATNPASHQPQKSLTGAPVQSSVSRLRFQACKPFVCRNPFNKLLKHFLERFVDRVKTSHDLFVLREHFLAHPLHLRGSRLGLCCLESIELFLLGIQHVAKVFVVVVRQGLDESIWNFVLLHEGLWRGCVIDLCRVVVPFGSLYVLFRHTVDFHERLS
jgi:hypothetical protein